MFRPNKYMVRRKRKWEVEEGRKRREKINLFFLTQFFDLWIWVVTSTSEFGLKVYRKVTWNPSPVLRKRCMSGNKNINIQLGHKMLTKATQWVGFYSRPTFCSVFVNVFRHGIFGSKRYHNLPLLCWWRIRASCASCAELCSTPLTKTPPETVRKRLRVEYMGQESSLAGLISEHRGWTSSHSAQAAGK